MTGTKTTSAATQRTRRRRGEVGQSLIVAIIVLFLLLFVGGLFITLVARNLQQARGAAQRSGASGFAEAGLRYLDDQLMKSPEGADWRSLPDDVPGDQNGDGDPVDINRNDPDFFWLKEYNPATGEGGFTRVTFGGPSATRGNLGGRALVRITYQPRPDDPNSKYLELESIGRVGTINPNDPTTFGNSERAGLRRELIAYKSIGIIDYARFVTNKDRKPTAASFGAPRLVQDRNTAATTDPPTLRDIESQIVGPIRVNGDVTFYGDNLFTLVPGRGDQIEIAGRIRLNDVSSTLRASDPAPARGSAVGRPVGRLLVNAAGTPAPANNNVLPSDSPDFTTLNGYVRDGVAAADVAGLPRSVSRLEPPIIDAPIGPNGLTRFRALTRDATAMSPNETGSNPVAIGIRDEGTAGVIGWGSGLYINNPNDVQTPSALLSGGATVRGDWLQPSSGNGGRRTPYWDGDFTYTPPAVDIELMPRYMRVTQFVDSTAGRTRPILRKPDGTPLRGYTQTIRYTYVPSLGAGAAQQQPKAALAPDDATDPRFKFAGYPQGDFVIFAEGNIRIRGVAGGLDPETRRAFLRHLTIVSNGTIYVDGNLLRDNITPDIENTSDQDGVPLTNIKGRSSIALLARDYICVNTTQFLTPGASDFTNEPGTGEVVRRVNSGNDPLNFRLTPGPLDRNNTTPTYLAATADAAGLPSVKFFFRHSSEFTTAAPGTEGAAINLFVNSVAAGTPNLFDFQPGIMTLIVPSLSYADQVFDAGPANLLLFPNNRAPFGPNPPVVGLSNLLAINYDVSPGGSSVPRAAYKLSRLGVAPLDIRIEAFLYAQEESFFIIPGPWFNPDPNDTYQGYIGGIDPSTGLPRNRRADEDTDPRTPRRVSHFFPFYRQPQDIRITLYGSVAENQTAPTGDQGAWLEKWGWVPRFMGSTGLPDTAGNLVTEQRTAHGPRGVYNDPAAIYKFPVKAYPTTNPPADADSGPGNGILFEFDDRAILPYARKSDGTFLLDAAGRPIPLRADVYGRTLPVVPRLPVAQGLLFFGENPVRQ